MEKSSEIPTILGARHLNLKKWFRLGVRSLLTACSKEEFCKAFAKFTNSEQECLQCLFIEVITSLHGNIEDEFKSLCLETQAGTILDAVEQHVEEQALDLLFAEKSNIGAIGPSLSEAKGNEIHFLTCILGKAEEQNRLMSARLDLLKKRGKISQVLQMLLACCGLTFRAMRSAPLLACDLHLTSFGLLHICFRLVCNSGESGLRPTLELTFFFHFSFLTGRYKAIA